MHTGQQWADGAGVQLGSELGLEGAVGDAGVVGERMTPADAIYRVATVTAVLYLLVSVL